MAIGFSANTTLQAPYDEPEELSHKPSFPNEYDKYLKKKSN